MYGLSCLFVHTLGINGGLCSVIVTLPEHLLYYDSLEMLCVSDPYYDSLEMLCVSDPYYDSLEMLCVSDPTGGWSLNQWNMAHFVHFLQQRTGTAVNISYLSMWLICFAGQDS